MAARAKKSDDQDVLQVTAPLVQVVTSDGKALHLYQGDVVPSNVKDESIENLKSLGFVSGSKPADEPESSDN